MASRARDIIFLLGAGASAEAGIPVSAEMIHHLEELLRTKDDWKRLSPVYNHVKSAIHFSAGIKGKYRDEVAFNIETLLITLVELERNEEHPLYPFIASWNSRFVALAGPGFKKVRDLRRRLLAVLKRWMCPDDSSRADYYKGFVTLQRDLNYPIHVFSLNYDLNVERLAQVEFRVETGFEGYGPGHPWDFERFLDMEASNNLPAELVLYKLHGSINWKRDQTNKNLYAVEQVETVDDDSMEVIFGRDLKLEAADPYLFYAYEFRAFALAARLVVILGYGFGDPHINKMLTQCMRSDPARKLLVIQPDQEEDEMRRFVAEQLELEDDQADRVFVQCKTAKEFLSGSNLAARLVELLPADSDAPF
jgi:hypothetical protein